MTLQEASKTLDISKKRLWRAVKSGFLEASRVQKGGRWEYRVSSEQLENYRRRYLDSLEMKAVDWGVSPEPPKHDDVGGQTETQTLFDVQKSLAELCHETERSELSASLLLDKLSSVERRNASLEFELAQMDKLLNESNERYFEQQARCVHVERILQEIKALI